MPVHQTLTSVVAAVSTMTGVLALSSGFITSLVPRQAAPTASGSPSDCASFAVAQKGDSCSSFASKNNISPAQLYSLNPSLGADGSQCSTALWVGSSYCVASKSDKPQSSPAIIESPTSPAASATRSSTSFCSYQEAQGAGQGKCMCGGNSFPVNPITTSTMDGPHTVFGIDYCHYTAWPTATTFVPAPLPTPDTSYCFDPNNFGYSGDDSPANHTPSADQVHACTMCVQQAGYHWDGSECEQDYVEPCPPSLAGGCTGS